MTDNPQTTPEKLMDTYEIIKKLIGPIDPTGRHEVDVERGRNLSTLLHVVNRLMFDINLVARHKDSHEESVRHLGQKASAFLQELSEADHD